MKANAPRIKTALQNSVCITQNKLNHAVTEDCWIYDENNAPDSASDPQQEKISESLASEIAAGRGLLVSCLLETGKNPDADCG